MRRRVQMYRALSAPPLLSGCERRSFFLLLGVCLCAGFFGGLSAGRWPVVLVSVAAFSAGKLGLAKIAQSDPQLSEVMIRSHRYGPRLDAVPRIREGG